ncbi:MAG: glutamyl-tRNA reductase [Alphaproteobacteria bacterium]|jgi:glutamyl-tRNA reductase
MLEKSFIVGIDHHASSVDVRQRLSELSMEELSTILPVDEIYVLSTCNRFEVYVSSPCKHSAKHALKSLKRVFAEQTSMLPSELEGHIYEKTGEDMLRHGFNVASSLESMVLGEPQILGQMKQAYKQAKSHGTMKMNLDKFLNATFHVGKRVRHETVLANESVSVASAAVRLAKNVYEPDFATCHVVLIGAGEMCTNAARHLKSQGVKYITIVNRTLENAKKLAEEVGGKAVRLPKLMSVLQTADVVMSCTGSLEPLVTKNMAADIMRSRYNIPLVFIDIAVPRNVAADVDVLEGVSLYDMDKLGEQVRVSKDKRAAQVGHAEVIINEEIKAFGRWSEERKSSHMIKHLRSTFDTVRDEVLTKCPSKEAEDATRLLLNKLMHKPTQLIKGGLIPAEAVEMALSLMFDMRCPRVEFLQVEANSVKSGECPFMDVVRLEGLNAEKH